MAFTSRTLGLARAAITAVGRALDASVRALTAAWAKAWDTLAGAFTAALEAILAAAEGWPRRRIVERDAALRDALESAERALADLAALAETEATGAADAAVDRAAGDQAGIINSQLPPGRRSNPAGGFLERAIAAIRARTRQRITTLTRPLAAEADRAMRRELVRGVRMGRNPRETAARMVKQVEGHFNGGLARAVTIARTETLDAYRQAAAATQDAHSEVVSGWTWLAKLNADCCPACWAMHGTEHPLDEPGPQGHANCKCSRAPKTLSWRELGFDLDEPEDRIPDALTVFRALPRADQLRIMGPARLDLLDRGAIQWSDLARLRDNPGWRPSYMPTPVRDLTPAG